MYTGFFMKGKMAFEGKQYVKEQPLFAFILRDLFTYIELMWTNHKNHAFNIA